MSLRMKAIAGNLLIVLICLLSSLSITAQDDKKSEDALMYGYQLYTEKQEIKLADINTLTKGYLTKKLNISSNFVNPSCVAKLKFDGQLFLKLNLGDYYQFGKENSSLSSFCIKYRVTVKRIGSISETPIINNQDISIELGNRSANNYNVKPEAIATYTNNNLFYYDDAFGIPTLIEGFQIINIQVINFDINGTSYIVSDNIDLTNLNPIYNEFINSLKFEFYFDTELKVLPINAANPNLPILVVNYYNDGTRYYDYYTVMHSTSKDNLMQPIRFEWELINSCANDIIPYYQVQILKLENTDPTLDNNLTCKAIVDWSKALNLYTGKNQKYIDVRLTEGDGIYLWRVRPIGNYYEGDISNNLNYGLWNDMLLHTGSPSTGIITPYPHTDGSIYDSKNSVEKKAKIYYFRAFVDRTIPYNGNINWASSKILTEDEYKGTKIFEGITYYDYLMRPRQAQAINNSQDISIVAQNYYDHLGRNTISTLAFPQKDDNSKYSAGMAYSKHYPEIYNGLYYKKDILNSNSGVNYNDWLYQIPSSDANFKANSSTGLLGTYYNGTMSQLSTDAVPKTEGYPFVRTVFEEDGTARVKAQGNAGEMYHLFNNVRDNTDPALNDHSNRISYSAVADEEILQLFADETPATNTLKKVVVTDENNVESINYINKEGQLIASAINPNSNLTDFNSLDPTEKTISDIYKYYITACNPVGTGYKYFGEKIINMPNQSNQATLHYDFTPLPQIVSTCITRSGIVFDYKIDLFLGGKNSLLNGIPATITPITTSSAITPINIPFVLPKDDYAANRTLEITNIDVIKNDITFNLINKLDSYFNPIITTELAELDRLIQLLESNSDPEVIAQNTVSKFYENFIFNNNNWIISSDNRFYEWKNNYNGCLDIKIPILFCDGYNITTTFEDYLYDKILERLNGKTLVTSTNTNPYSTNTTDLTISSTTNSYRDPHYYYFSPNIYNSTNNRKFTYYSFSAGRFNTLINNMLADGYSLQQLSKAWMATVDLFLNIGIKQITTNPDHYEINYDYDLLESFLCKVGKLYRGISNHPYGLAPTPESSTDYGKGYLDYAHQYFEYNYWYPMADCNNMLNTGTVPPSLANSTYTWEDVYSCINNTKTDEQVKDLIDQYDDPFDTSSEPTFDILKDCIDPTTNEPQIDCINSLIGKMVTDCTEGCDKRDFRERVEGMYRANYYVIVGDKSYLASANATPIIIDHWESNTPYSNATLPYPFEDIPPNKIVTIARVDCHVAALVDECKSMCEVDPLTETNLSDCSPERLDILSTQMNELTIASSYDYSLTIKQYEFNYYPYEIVSPYSNCYSLMNDEWPPSKIIGNSLSKIQYCPITICWLPYSIQPDDPPHRSECNEETFREIKLALTTRINEIYNQQYGEVMTKLETLLADVKLNPKNYFIENYSVELKNVGYKHFTLYYYDRSGNLVQTIPPKGAKPTSMRDPVDMRKYDHPPHTYNSTMQYNSLGQIVESKAPEETSAQKFIYDSKNRLIISQNANQSSINTATYLKYDKKGRLIEVGEIELAGLSLADLKTNMEADINYPTLNRSEYSEFFYSKPYNFSSSNNPYSAETQKNILNKLSYTVRHNPETGSANYFDVYTIYSYDIYGNTEWVIRRLPDLNYSISNNDIYSKIRYEYEAISGNITLVAYNENRPDQFYQKFDYDKDNRVSKVYSSRDKLAWDNDETYEFYLLGPLKRKIIGQDIITKNDYYYTLQGALKAVNSDNLNANSGDGTNILVSNGRQAKPAKTPFGFSLNYYNNDFSSWISPGLFSSSISPSSGSFFNGLIKKSNYSYSDNIRNTKLNPIFNSITETNTYNYDILYRLTKSIPASGKFGSEFQYDPNSNLLSSIRKDANNNPKETISSILNTNDDKLSKSVLSQTNQTTYYQYDNIGNLINSNIGSIGTPPPNPINPGYLNIEWTYDGKVRKTVSKITEPPAPCDFTSDNPQFTVFNLYDAAGNKVAVRNEISGNAVTGAPSKAGAYDCEECAKIFNLGSTYYIYDLNNSNVAIYKSNLDNCGLTTTNNPVNLDRWLIYGLQGRIGSQLPGLSSSFTRDLLYTNAKPIPPTGLYTGQRLLDNKEYELTDHLGNVRVIMSDVKIPTDLSLSRLADTYNADVLNVNNYYPYGKPITEQSWTKPRYLPSLFGYNGMMKDNHISGEGNAYYTLFREYDPNLGRWWKRDPIFQPWQSPYSAFDANPAMFTDVWGLKPHWVPNENGGGNWTIDEILVVANKVILSPKERQKAINEYNIACQAITIQNTKNFLRSQGYQIIESKSPPKSESGFWDSFNNGAMESLNSIANTIVDWYNHPHHFDESVVQGIGNIYNTAIAFTSVGTLPIMTMQLSIAYNNFSSLSRSEKINFVAYKLGNITADLIIQLPAILGSLGSSLGAEGLSIGFQGLKITGKDLIKKEVVDVSDDAGCIFNYQKHHFASNKNNYWTPQFKKIADEFGLELNGEWNIESLPQRGRHPNLYHKFIFVGMKRASIEANGNTEKFLNLFEIYIKNPVRKNPSLLRKSGWTK